jgi:hypothetical protein
VVAVAGVITGRRAVPVTEDQAAAVEALIAQEDPVAEDPDGVVGLLRRLCRALVRALPATGVGVSLMTPDGLRGAVAGSDVGSEELEELQFTLGEGPCVDAFAACRPVLEPDLGAGKARWPGYAAAAQDLRVRAAFAFPLQVGAARLGVMDVYRDQPGSLSTGAVAQAITFAEVAVTTLLDGQSDARPGKSAAGLEEALQYRWVLYQAQGMVMVQLGVDLAEAMARLRAHAYAHDRRLSDVAADVVAHRLRLDTDRST